MSDRAFFFTLHAVSRQLAAMPNDFYFIRLIHRATHRVCPGERLWDAGQLTRGSVLRFLSARNLQGFDVYLWPYAEHGNAGYILVDLDQAAVDIIPRMRANGHEPCVLLQTSPGHLQAWVRVSTTPLEPALATLVGKQLAHTYSGDLASTDWRHLGRLAGFTNQKSLYRAAFGSPPWVKILHADPVLASAAQDLLHVAVLRLARQSTPATSDVCRRVFPPGNPPTEITAPAAKRIYLCWIEHWHIGIALSDPTGASSISGSLESCSPCTSPLPKYELSFAWAVQISRAIMAIPKTICVAPWPGLFCHAKNPPRMA